MTTEEAEHLNKQKPSKSKMISKLDFVARWAFAYSAFSTLVHLESWEDVEHYIKQINSDLGALLARIGDICTILTIPWELLKSFVYSFDLFSVPTEWQDPSLLAVIILWSPLTILLNAATVLFIKSTVAAGTNYAKLLMILDRGKSNAEIVEILDKFISKYSLHAVSMGPVADYMRGLRENLSDKYLLVRKWRSVEQMTKPLRLAEKRLDSKLLEVRREFRHHVARILIALALLVIIVGDRLNVGDTIASFDVLWRTLLLMIAAIVIPVLLYGVVMIVLIAVLVATMAGLETIVSILPSQRVKNWHSWYSRLYTFRTLGTVGRSYDFDENMDSNLYIGGYAWARDKNTGKWILCMERDISFASLSAWTVQDGAICFLLLDGSTATLDPMVSVTASEEKVIRDQGNLVLGFAPQGEVLLDTATLAFKV